MDMHTLRKWFMPVCTCLPHDSLQASMGDLLRDMGMCTEAEAAYCDAFEQGIKVVGPRGTAVVSALRGLYGLYCSEMRLDEALTLRSRAKQLGCDDTDL